jgi:hypothetical protein
MFYAVFEDAIWGREHVVLRDGWYDSAIDHEPAEMVKQAPETYVFQTQQQAEAALNKAQDHYDGQMDDGTDRRNWSVNHRVLPVPEYNS